MNSEPFVNNFAVFPLEERAHFRLPGQDGRDQFPGDLLLQLVRMGDVPFLQSKFALPAEQQHKLHLFGMGYILN